MMLLHRRHFLQRTLALGGLGLLAGCSRLTPMPPSSAKVPRVGLLLFYSDASALEPQAFLRGMHEAGYVDGQSVVFEYRRADGRPERLPSLAAELLNANVDLIWT